MNQLDLYLVEEGNVTPATPETDLAGINSVLVAATTEANALVIARMYEDEEVGADNIWYSGEAVGCVSATNEFGDYL